MRCAVPTCSASVRRPGHHILTAQTRFRPTSATPSRSLDDRAVGTNLIKVRSDTLVWA